MNIKPILSQGNQKKFYMFIDFMKGNNYKNRYPVISQEIIIRYMKIISSYK